MRGRIGIGPADEKEIRIFNHVVSWSHTSTKLEADQRHAETVILELMKEVGANFRSRLE